MVFEEIRIDYNQNQYEEDLGAITNLTIDLREKRRISDLDTIISCLKGAVKHGNKIIKLSERIKDPISKKFLENYRNIENTFETLSRNKYRNMQDEERVELGITLLTGKGKTQLSNKLYF